VVLEKKKKEGLMFVGVDQRYMTCIKSEKQREKIRERPNHRQNGEGEKKKRKKGKKYRYANAPDPL